MKIRAKITLGLGTILIVSGVIFNIAFRNIFIDKMELTIKESLIQTMNNTYEIISYRLFQSSEENDNEKLKNESDYLVSYISVNSECNVEIRDYKNDVLVGNINEDFLEELNLLNTETKDNSGLIYIDYRDSTVYGILSYTIYNNENNIGSFNVVKEYKDLYLDSINTIKNITIAEIITFITIFLAAFIINSTIIRPITKLTEGIKKLEEGDYEFAIENYKNDEIGVLSREFVNMRTKIKSQIDTIKSEKQKVETLSNHRKEFFDNVTHEIKTPLTAITGYSEMLKDNIVDDEDFKVRALTRIHSESERVNKLVLDLISVSKGLSETKEEFKEKNLKNILRDLSEDLQFKANKYLLTIRYELEDGIVLCEENRVKQLFINIIDNAIKYSNKEGIVDIKSYCSLDKYVVEIKNSSDGIPKEIYESIFDPFVKIDKQTEKYSSGLGLYISNEIVREHNGTIEIENGEIVTVRVKFNLKGVLSHEKKSI